MVEADLPGSCQKVHERSISPWFLVFILTERNTVCFPIVWNGFKVQKSNGKGQMVLFLNFFFFNSSKKLYKREEYLVLLR